MGKKTFFRSSKESISNLIFTLPLFMQKVRHVKQLPVDLESLKHRLSSLVLPSQQVHFSEHMYAFYS